MYIFIQPFGFIKFHCVRYQFEIKFTSSDCDAMPFWVGCRCWLASTIRATFSILSLLPLFSLLLFTFPSPFLTCSSHQYHSFTFCFLNVLYCLVFHCTHPFGNRSYWELNGSPGKVAKKLSRSFLKRTKCMIQMHSFGRWGKWKWNKIDSNFENNINNNLRKTYNQRVVVQKLHSFSALSDFNNTHTWILCIMCTQFLSGWVCGIPDML